MQHTHAGFAEAQLAIREVRTAENPAVQGLIAAAATLAATVDRVAREHALR